MSRADWVFATLLLAVWSLLISPVLWLALLLLAWPCCRLTGTPGADCDYWSRRGGLC